MGNYTRANLQLWPAKGHEAGLLEESIAELCNWIREKARAWNAIHIIPRSKVKCVELRFTTKRSPESYLQELADQGFEVWAITIFEGGFCQDMIRYYRPFTKSHHSHYQADAVYAFDEIEITTSRPDRLMPCFEHDCRVQQNPDGVHIESSGLYNAETFLYYGKEHQHTNEFFDDNHQPDLEECHSKEGRLSNLITPQPIPWVNDFLEYTAKNKRETIQYQNIEYVEFRFRERVTNRIFFDRDSYIDPLWVHMSHDGFSNCVDDRYLDYIGKIIGT